LAKTALRKLTVDGKNYLWKVSKYYDVWEGTVIIYAKEIKHKQIIAQFTIEQRTQHFPTEATVIYKWTNEKGLPPIQQPIIAVRIIRYAVRQLNWQPTTKNDPLIIEDGYELLKQIGYEPLLCTTYFGKSERS